MSTCSSCMSRSCSSARATPPAQWGCSQRSEPGTTEAAQHGSINQFLCVLILCCDIVYTLHLPENGTCGLNSQQMKSDTVLYQSSSESSSLSPSPLSLSSITSSSSSSSSSSFHCAVPDTSWRSCTSSFWSVSVCVCVGGGGGGGGV